MGKAAEREALYNKRKAIRKELRAKRMYIRRMAAFKKYKNSLKKLRAAAKAAKHALGLRNKARKAMKISIANDVSIIFTWVHKIKKATILRRRAQRAQKIAHRAYLKALKAKLLALKQMKAAHVRSKNAHKKMVKHRRQARLARRAMKAAYVALKGAIKHRNLKNAFWKKMITARKAAHLRMDKALRAKALAIKAWKLAVIKRKHAQNKRNGAIRAKIAMVKSMKKHIKKAINWAIKMKLKHKAMMKAKNLIAEHKVMTSDAAKVRLGERIAKLKKQLKHRKLDHKNKTIKEKRARSIWVGQRKVNAAMKVKISKVVSRISKWKAVYYKESKIRKAAAKRMAHFKRDHMIVIGITKKAIRATKIAIAAKKLADNLHKKAVALHKKNVTLRKAAEKMTKLMKKQMAQAIANGRRQKKLAFKFGLKALAQRKIMIKMKLVYKKQNDVRGHAKQMHAKYVKRVTHFKRVARALKIKISHWKAVAARKAKEMRRVNQKVEDQEAKTKRAKAATKKAINLKIKFDLLSKKENRMKLHFMRLAKIARGHVKVARNEHKRQVKMKKDMLAKYARITAKNLRKAKSTVRREVRVTLKAHRAKRSWMRKESRSLVRLAKEKARMLTIRKTHTDRRSKNRKVAERVVRKHDRIRAKAAFRSRMFVRHTVAANRRTKSANFSRMTIIAAAKKAARLSAKLICNIRLSTSMKRHMFDSEMCERSKNFLNKLTDEKANAKRLSSEKQVVKFWCTARNARRQQVALNKKCKSAGKYKNLAMHNENMANIATLAAWGSPAQKKIPKNGKGHISYKKWYAKVMKLAASLQKTPCPVMPGAPAKKSIVHTRHHKSLKVVGGNTMVLTHTNYYYTKPCTQKCKVVKRSVSIKKHVIA